MLSTLWQIYFSCLNITNLFFRIYIHMYMLKYLNWTQCNLHNSLSRLMLFNKNPTIRTTCVYSIVYTFWLWSYHRMWCFFKQFAICIFKNFIFIHVHPSDHVHTISVMLHFTFFFVEHQNNNVSIPWNLYYKCRQFIIK